MPPARKASGSERTMISVVINTLNEEKNLPKALTSVRQLADEIVVVDMKSDDKTQEIAKKSGAKVYEHKRTGYVEPARNFAISKAKGEWILILDADEEISTSLSTSLRKIIKNPRADYYRLPRKNIIFQKWIKHSRWWPDYNIRFFKKGKVSWSEIIHSVPETRGKGLDLRADEKNAIIHHNYISIEQFVQRLNRYTTLHAKLLINDGYKFEWTDLIRKPTNEFLSRYFQGEGYKDGLHGLALSALQAFSELVMYLKVWEKSKFEESEIKADEVIDGMKESEADLHYWQAETILKEGGGIKNRIKRKLKLF
jgi:(heptosyl)LPS beta-1,4-glucosyltransferase